MFEEKQQGRSFYSYVKNVRQFILGYISAYTANLIITPTQFQRRRQFLLKHPHPNNHSFYGVFDIIPRMIAIQGWKSLWSGSLKNTNRFSIWQGFSFAFQDLVNNFILHDARYRAVMTTFQRHFFSGMLSGMFCSSLSYPIDITITTLYRLNKHASGRTEEKIATFSSSVKYILQKQGFAGFYRYFSIALLGTGIHRGLYFGIYFANKSSQNEGFLLKFWHGWISGFISYIVSYPCDAIRQKMWFAKETSERFQNVFDCVNKIVKTRGVQSLYSGFFTRFGFGIKWALLISFYDLATSFMQQEHI